MESSFTVGRASFAGMRATLVVGEQVSGLVSKNRGDGATS